MLFKMVIKTKLYIIKNIWQWFSCNKCKVILTFNKPAYVGMCILHLSKVLIYEFHNANI